MVFSNTYNHTIHIQSIHHRFSISEQPLFDPDHSNTSFDDVVFRLLHARKLPEHDLKLQGVFWRAMCWAIQRLTIC